jgi:hypothetical protein
LEIFLCRLVDVDGAFLLQAGEDALDDGFGVADGGCGDVRGALPDGIRAATGG